MNVDEELYLDRFGYGKWEIGTPSVLVKSRIIDIGFGMIDLVILKYTLHILNIWELKCCRRIGK